MRAIRENVVPGREAGGNEIISEPSLNVNV
jgi:hypothetical protein